MKLAGVSSGQLPIIRHVLLTIALLGGLYYFYFKFMNYLKLHCIEGTCSFVLVLRYNGFTAGEAFSLILDLTGWLALTIYNAFFN